jgi:hypothetical protein
VGTTPHPGRRTAVPLHSLLKGYDHVQFRTLLLSGGNDLARFSYHRYKNDAVLVFHEQDCFYQWAVLSDGSRPWQIYLKCKPP